MKLYVLPFLFAASSQVSAANPYNPDGRGLKKSGTGSKSKKSGSGSKSASIGVCDEIYPGLTEAYREFRDSRTADWRELCSITGWEEGYIELGDAPIPPFVFGPIDPVGYDACVCNNVFEQHCFERDMETTCKKVSALADMVGLGYFPGAGGFSDLGYVCDPFSRRRMTMKDGASSNPKTFKEFSLNAVVSKEGHERELGTEPNPCDDFNFETLVSALASLADEDMDECAFMCLQEYTFLGDGSFDVYDE